MNRPVRVLIVEDLPLTAALVKTELEAQPAVTAEYAHTLAEALARLAGRNDIDVVLLDLGLPDADGIKAVEELMSKSSEVPIVVLSGRVEEYAAAIEAGAHEFLFKPAAGPAIVAALRSAVIRHRVRPAYQPARAAQREVGKLIEKAKRATSLKSPPPPDRGDD